MIEALAGLVPTALVVVDWLLRRNKSAKDRIQSAARAVFPQVVSIVGDDKVRAHQLFRSLFDSAWKVSGQKLSPAVVANVEQLFESMWDLYARELYNDASARLLKAGTRMEKFGTELQRKTSLAKSTAT